MNVIEGYEWAGHALFILGLAGLYVCLAHGARWLNRRLRKGQGDEDA